jgi:hypothetical protein
VLAGPACELAEDLSALVVSAGWCDHSRTLIPTAVAAAVSQMLLLTAAVAVAAEAEQSSPG